MGINISKNINKRLNKKYDQNLLDLAKQSETDAFKTSSKRVIQKTAEATGDIIGKKMLIKLQEPQNFTTEYLRHK